MKFRLDLYTKEFILFGATLAVGVFSAYRNIASSVPIIIPEVRFGWGDIIFLAALALFFIFFSRYQRVVRFSFTFAAKGIFDYHNDRNPKETGTIIVR